MSSFDPAVVLAILVAIQPPSAADIRNAILKNSASKGVLGQYWDKHEQEAKMIAVYNKYSARGGVWSAAAHAVHTAQLKHLRKGCLSRLDQTVASDGSRIEGSHKGWNSIQRASASGLELQSALSHDFVLRRNIRVAFAKTAVPGNASSNLDTFLRSTFGSHHSRLVSRAASMFNDIIHIEATRSKTSASSLSLHPVLKHVASGETFGLVSSQHSDTFGGLLTIKDENTDGDDQLLNQALDSTTSAEEILGDLNIDPALLLQPLQGTAAPAVRLRSDNITTPPRTSVAPAMELDAIEQVIDKRTSAPGLSRKRKDLDASTIPEEPSHNDLEAGRTPQLKKQRVGVEVCAVFIVLVQRPWLRIMYLGSVVPRGIGFWEDYAFTFNMPTTAAAVPPPQGSQATELAKLLPLPGQLDSTTPRLTRSEILFARTTGVNPKSLEIGRGKEFFLFVDMRCELGWKSSDMTSKKWLDATALYNERLGDAGVPKRPRALSDKLGELERMVLTRIATKSFKSQRGDDKFWMKHCFAIPLVKLEADSNPEKIEEEKATAARTVATCKRCNKIMYAGGKKSPENHKKGYCSDGFKQKVVEGESAPWPQPTGLFTTGSEFHPLIFLTTIREVYEKVVVEGETDVSMEQEAFLSMLPGRTTISATGAVLFRLFSAFAIPADDETPDTLFVESEGVKYLRIDALRNTDVSILPISA
ncbi:hypothetical protein C8R46DRAFT_1237214 [Mycena filopes]|nr:hypothetical protein C8R46DRAFT_1237214 [Mycena filopes]